MNTTISRYFLSMIFLGVVFTAYPTLSHATHSWGGYHWARTTPQFTLKLGDNLTTADWKAHLGQASSDWNSPNNESQASPITTAVTKGAASKRCPTVTGTTQVCNDKYGNNGWLGLASIYIADGVHIIKGFSKDERYLLQPEQIQQSQ